MTSIPNSPYRYIYAAVSLPAPKKDICSQVMPENNK